MLSSDGSMLSLPEMSRPIFSGINFSGKREGAGVKNVASHQQPCLLGSRKAHSILFSKPL